MTVVFHLLKIANVMGSFVTLMVVMWEFLRFEYELTSSIWIRARLVSLAGTNSDFNFSWELGRPVLCTQLQNFSITDHFWVESVIASMLDECCLQSFFEFD